jgi:riboflavin biosynthesis pyrimidine reductase
MPRTTRVKLAPLAALFQVNRGTAMPLPDRLARLYGGFRMPVPRSRPLVYSNFVTTLDGVVSLNVKGHASGGDISGFSAQDRMVMGLLRAVADVVVIGSGTLQVDRRHVWTAEAIFPPLASDYGRLRETLGKREPPLNVIVSGSGEIDLRLPVFSSPDVRTMIVTTASGAARLRRQQESALVQIHAVRSKAGAIPARSILQAVLQASDGKRILVEGGPRLLGDFYAEGLIDEQFLTLSPQIAGRDTDDHRLSLVMGKLFAPRVPLWGALVEMRQGGSHLFLRYAFRRPAQ